MHYPDNSAIAQEVLYRRPLHLQKLQVASPPNAPDKSLYIPVEISWCHVYIPISRLQHSKSSQMEMVCALPSLAY